MTEEKQKEKQKEKPTAKPLGLKGLGLMSKIFMLLIAAGMMAVSLSAFLLLLLGMLPGVVEMFIAKGSSRYASGTISIFNFIGIVPYLGKILHSSEPGLTAQQLLFDIHTWFYIYIAAMVGILMVWLMPQLGSVIFLGKAQMIIRKSKNSQQALIDEWGPDVAKGTKPAHPSPSAK